MKTGEFMDRMIMAKELMKVGSKEAVSGNGYFQREFYSLEANIKDKKQVSMEN